MYYPTEYTYNHPKPFFITYRPPTTIKYQFSESNKNCKVVPPSYKLVYNPINYGYITYKP